MGKSIFKGAIFDLDGLLIDSEPVWGWAQLLALREWGVVLTDSMQKETSGLGLEAALFHWKNWFPEADLKADQIKPQLHKLALGRVVEMGRAKPGVRFVLEACRDAGFKMAIASSSPSIFIYAAIARIGIRSFFHEVISAEEEPFSKPHPAVYLTAARRLGLTPDECIAFEDSLHGLCSAKAAGMYCIVVPEGANLNDPRFGIADRILPSLENFKPQWLTAQR